MMLMDARSRAPVFVRDVEGLDGDFAVLLHDAAQMFCQAVSEFNREAPDSRWRPGLGELLLAHPEKCEEMLAQIEEGRRPEPLEVQYVSA